MSAVTFDRNVFALFISQIFILKLWKISFKKLGGGYLGHFWGILVKKITFFKLPPFWQPLKLGVFLVLFIHVLQQYFFLFLYKKWELSFLCQNLPKFFDSKPNLFWKLLNKMVTAVVTAVTRNSYGRGYGSYAPPLIWPLFLFFFFQFFNMFYVSIIHPIHFFIFLVFFLIFP